MSEPSKAPASAPTVRWEMAAAVLVLVAMLALFFKLQGAEAPAPELPTPTTHEVVQPTSPATPDAAGPTQ